MSLLKVRLNQKLLLNFILVSTLPLLIANYLWFSSSRDQIRKSTSATLTSYASDIAHQIESYLQTKEIGLILHSQTESLLTENYPKATLELQNFLFQDLDIQELTVLDREGKEAIHVSRNKIFASSELTNQSDSLAFKIPTFLGGESYISHVYISDDGNPEIYIAIPIVKPEKSQELMKLTTSSVGEPRLPGKILGVIKANYVLSNLWQKIETFKIGNNGYVFLIDDLGNVIAHPSRKLAIEQKNLRGLSDVNNYVINRLNYNGENQQVTQAKNEFGELSLISLARIQPTNWGAIAQIPVSDILLETNKVALFAAVLFAAILILIILISLWISRQIVKPIEQLERGSQTIGQGDLNYSMVIKSGDEIEDLGNAFNKMAVNLHLAFSTLERDKRLISAERNKLAIILSGVRDAVIVVNLNREIILFNKAAEELIGLKSVDVIEKHINHVIKVFDQNYELPVSQYCPIRSDNYEGVVFSKENLKIIGRNDKETRVQLIAGKIKEGLKVDLGCILTLHDITKEAQLEEMKIDFVSMAAHELRTPLTAIQGYASLLFEEANQSLNSNQKEQIRRLLTSSDQLGSLIDNLLSVSRIERSIFKVVVSPSDLVEIVQSVINDFREQTKIKNQTLEFILPSDKLPQVLVDRFRISQVLLNLLTNASNYTQPCGKITVIVKNTKEGGFYGQHFLSVSVMDTGQGIPKEALPNLFTKFFRVSGALEQGSKGTGLGLYISKSIITMHKGKIWAESTLGKGSIFTFTVPVATEDEIAKYNQNTHVSSLSESTQRGIIINKEMFEKRFGKKSDLRDSKPSSTSVS